MNQTIEVFNTFKYFREFMPRIDNLINSIKKIEESFNGRTTQELSFKLYTEEDFVITWLQPWDLTLPDPKAKPFDIMIEIPNPIYDNGLVASVIIKFTYICKCCGTIKTGKLVGRSAVKILEEIKERYGK